LLASITDYLTVTKPNRFRFKWAEAKRAFWWFSTGNESVQEAPAKLKDAELALVGRVNLTPALLAQHLFAEFVDPQDRDREREQERIEPFGVAKARGVEVEAARFIVMETLFDVHATQIVAQDPAIRITVLVHNRR
jgi:hypothetical protein